MTSPPPAATALPATWESTLLPITLMAFAPEPVSATPSEPPASDSAAATDVALIVAVSAECSVMPPSAVTPARSALFVSVKPGASLINAVTSLRISLRASATPIATATPALPTAAARDAAALMTVMWDLSVAERMTSAAVIPCVAETLLEGATPSIEASTFVAMKFFADVPAPASPTPNPPPEIAAEPAPTPAVILAVEEAVCVRSPFALMLESVT